MIINLNKNLSNKINLEFLVIYDFPKNNIYILRIMRELIDKELKL